MNGRLRGFQLTCAEIGHFSDTVIAVCSTASSWPGMEPVLVAKLRFIFAIQFSIGSNRCFIRPGQD